MCPTKNVPETLRRRRDRSSRHQGSEPKKSSTGPISDQNGQGNGIAKGSRMETRPSGEDRYVKGVQSLGARLVLFPVVPGRGWGRGSGGTTTLTTRRRARGLANRGEPERRLNARLGSDSKNSTLGGSSWCRQEPIGPIFADIAVCQAREFVIALVSRPSFARGDCTCSIAMWRRDVCCCGETF